MERPRLCAVTPDRCSLAVPQSQGGTSTACERRAFMHARWAAEAV